MSNCNRDLWIEGMWIMCFGFTVLLGSLIALQFGTSYSFSVDIIHNEDKDLLQR